MAFEDPSPEPAGLGRGTARTLTFLRTSGRLVLFLALAFLLFLVAAMLGVEPAIARASAGQAMPRLLGWATVQAALVLLASLVPLRLLDGLPLSALGLGRSGALRDSARGALFGAAWLALPLALLWGLGGVAATGLPPPGAEFLAWAAGAVLVNAFMQEVAFHGYPWLLLERALGPAWALGLTAALFAAWHADAIAGSALAAANLFGAGLLFGALRWRSGALWLPVAAHATWNVLLGPVLGLTVSGSDLLAPPSGALLRLAGPDLLTGGAFGFEGSLLVSLTTALAFAAGLRWRPTASPAPR